MCVCVQMCVPLFVCKMCVCIADHSANRVGSAAGLDQCSYGWARGSLPVHNRAVRYATLVCPPPIPNALLVGGVQTSCLGFMFRSLIALLCRCLLPVRYDTLVPVALGCVFDMRFCLRCAVLCAARLRYKKIVKYKTAFYSFYLPVAAAMIQRYSQWAQLLWRLRTDAPSPTGRHSHLCNSWTVRPNLVALCVCVCVCVCVL